MLDHYLHFNSNAYTSEVFSELMFLIEIFKERVHFRPACKDTLLRITWWSAGNRVEALRQHCPQTKRSSLREEYINHDAQHGRELWKSK